jgi:PAS domain S-box-containing protein
MKRIDPLMLRIRMAFAITCVSLCVLAVAGYQTFGRLVQTAEKAARADRTLDLLNDLATDVGRTHRSLIAYVLSGRQEDRQEFELHTREQSLEVQKLDGLLAPAVRAELKRRVDANFALQHEAAQARADGREDEAARLTDAVRAHDSVDGLFTFIEKTRKEEELHRVSWYDARDLGTGGYLLAGAGALLLAMLTWAGGLVRRYEDERRRIESLLGQSKAMNRALAENMADGLVTMDEDLTILAINRAAQEMLGYTKSDLVGRNATEMVFDYPGRDAFRARLAECIGARAPFRIAGIDMIIGRRDGRGLPVQVSMNDVQIEGRRRITALLRDMSQIRQATEAVQASEEHLREITDTLPTIVVEFDKDRRFRFINRACAEFFGMPAEDAIGRRLEDILGKPLEAQHAPYVAQALRGACARYEITAGDAQGRVGTHEMVLVPRRAPGTGEVIGAYAFATDITAMKRIDQMKTEFISTVSHELRTPLTSIRGSLGLMSGGIAGTLPQAAANLVDIAQSNCDRLIRLINDILDTEKIESGKVPLNLQPLPLAPLVLKALEQNEGFAQQHGVRLALQAEATTPLVVRADADRLVQVLTNLLSNAVKFSPAGAEVTVRLSATAHAVRVEVADRGPGIPPEFQQRIFQKFSQADTSDTRSKSGTGLGLNISRSLVEKMGGQIGFTSTPGSGATFYFELPRHDGPVTRLAVPMAPGWVPPRVTRILHVEPDADIRAIVAKLAGPRAACVPAASLREARQSLAEAEFDLVVLEPELADGNGWELVAAIEQLRSRPPVLVFSAADALPPEGCDVAGVMVKCQASETALMQTIRRTLAGALDTIPAPLED